MKTLFFLALAVVPVSIAKDENSELLRAYGVEERGYQASETKDTNLLGGVSLSLDQDKGEVVVRKLRPAESGAPPPEPPSRLPLLLAVGASAFLVLGGLFWPSAKAAPAIDANRDSGMDAKYPIVRVLGEGGMGVVYEARDRALDRRVAIKKIREELKQNRGELDQLLREARLVASLHHPNIVGIHGVMEQAGEIYLIFEFVEGRTVEQLIKEGGRLGFRETVGILAPVCEALEFAHGHGVIHRDLKPSNVMLTSKDEVKVMDFGVARRSKDPTHAQLLAGAPELTSAIGGTPLYMAPESERGLVGPGTDMFSLGAMTYEMLSGKPPFPPPARAEQKLTRSYTPLPEVAPGLPPRVYALVDAALEPDPERRPQSPGKFREILKAN